MAFLGLARPGLGRADTPDAEPPASPSPSPRVFYTKADGLGPCAGDGFIAFATVEQQVDADLNGDGDKEDAVIRHYDLVSRKTVNTQAVVSSLPVAVGGSVIAFVTDEGDVGQDLNGDGDAWDDVIRYYDVARGKLVNTGREGSDPSTDGRIIAFSVFEGRPKADLNGDGDQEDEIIMYWDVAEGRAVNTGVIGRRPSVGYGIIAMETSERDVGQDLNGDGDARDVVIRYYDLASGQVVSTGAEGLRPQVGWGFIAFIADEFLIGKDLNKNGFEEDELLRYYDLRRQRLVELNTRVSRQQIGARGTFILFEQFERDMDEDLNEDGDPFDDVILYYDVVSGQVVNTKAAGLFPCTDGHAAYFATYEPDLGQDLNEDKDIQDLVVGYLDLPSRVALQAGWNLIALPRGLAKPEDVAGYLKPIEGKYELLLAYDASPRRVAGGDSRPGGLWRGLAPGGRPAGLAPLERVEPSMGLWIKMREPAVLLVPGQVPETTTVKLAQGWNLIGFPARTGRPLKAALAKIEGQYDAVFGYVPGSEASWQGFHPALPEAPNSLRRLGPGAGYWVHMLREATLEISY